MIKRLPWIFLYSRLASGILFTLIFISSFLFDSNFYSKLSITCTILFAVGFIGDILDGIIARRFNMDTSKMRRLDSLYDMVFWIGATFLLFLFHFDSPRLFLIGVLAVSILLLSEYTVALTRFKQTPSSHNYTSKFFGLFLFALYLISFLNIESPVFIIITFSIGFLARLDALLIYSILPKWTQDIPSFYHAIMIRQGKSFKKYKLFHSEEK